MALYTSTGGNGFASANFGGDLVNMEGNTPLHLNDIAELTDALGDTFICGIGNDTVFSGIGSDIILGGDGDDLIAGGFGADIMDGGTGVDTYDVSALIGNYVWNMTTGVTNVLGESAVNFEWATMGGGNDSVTGNVAANFINGGTGNDTLRGGGGDDTLFGQNGDDTFLVGAADSVCDIIGSNGFDTLDLGGISSAGVVLNGARQIWDVAGLGDANGMSGIEHVIGTQVGDDMAGSRGAELYEGGNGNDTLSGKAGNDTLIGGAGDDNLDGGLGDDRLEGGTFGVDRLTGGDGLDTFVFHIRCGADTVKDFQDGSDKMDVTVFGLDEFALLAAARQVHGDVLITLDSRDSILLKSFDIANLDATDFLF